MVADGCTLWLNSWGDISWRTCCDAHDIAFYELADFTTSNIELALCVAHVGLPWMGIVMLIGVMTFGSLFYAKAHFQAWWRQRAHQDLKLEVKGRDMPEDTKFTRCHAVTAAWEGGWSDHPSDPGGKTMYGITETVFHAWLKAKGIATRPVRSITKSEALEIYHAQYWKPVGGPGLAAGVDLAAYDAAVNSGVSRGRKWLLSSIGGPDHETVKKLCAKRLSFVQGLSNWKVFGKGWGNRIADVQAKGVSWALANNNDPAIVKDQLKDEADIASNKGKNSNVGAGASAAGGITSTGFEQVGTVPQFLGIGFVIIFIVLGLFLYWRGAQKRREAKAYLREAQTIAQ